jgi:Tannase-like family of unknown function (DUF6351)
VSIIDRLAGAGAGAGAVPATVSLWTMTITDASGKDEPDDPTDPVTGTPVPLAPRPTLALDAWLTAAEAHRASEGGSWRDALVATKPATAESRCEPPDAAPIVGPDANADPACDAAFPIHEEPRMAAGAPRSGDVLKRALQPVDDAAALYEVELTEAQLDRLAEIFPTGVCDYDEPSQGFVEFDEPWYDFGAAD